MQVLAFGALTLSSYWQYRESDGKQISSLESRVAILESRTGDLWTDWIKQRGRQ
jgi:hypothetical protein